MSADVLSGGRGTEPALWNRLLAVAAVVFAVPVMIEIHARLVGSVEASAAVRLAVAASASLLAGAAVAGLFGRFRATPELRTARGLALALSVQALLLVAFVLA